MNEELNLRPCHVSRRHEGSHPPPRERQLPFWEDVFPSRKRRRKCGGFGWFCWWCIFYLTAMAEWRIRARWSGTTKNPDVSTGPITHSVAHSLAPLTCSPLICSLCAARLAALTLLLACSFTHSRTREKSEWIDDRASSCSEPLCREGLGGRRVAELRPNQFLRHTS